MKVWDKLKDRFKRKRACYDFDDTMVRIVNASKKVDPGSEEWRKLRMDYEQEIKSKKLAQELRFAGVPWIQVVFICGMLVISGMAFLLDMDSPKATKIADKLISLLKNGLTKHF